MIRRTLIYFSLFSFLLFGCQDEPDIPAGTVSEAKMAQILTDIHIIEARVGRLALTSLDSSTIITEHLKLQVFKKYGVDSATYNRSYKFYSTNPIYLERIYDIVVKQLEVRQKKKNYKGL
ncbi:DUF4296 domain-containing protein [Runella sp.]|uniref:DUF4296 domain-containing protein n=1 Tax=Runella sp. TaxID=1960881 RepID=UPI003D0E2B2A